MSALLSMLLLQTGPMTEQPLFHHRTARNHWGQVELSFELPPKTRALQIRFAQRLDGMKVEVRGGDARGHSIPLQPEQRVGGSAVRVDWKPEEINEVVVVLHHHLRDEPVVVGWATGAAR